ncbi:terpenoid synthase [Clavulina sp. PMI_390]|nr:terpenoid synthase [Clavulina sp. PMI_390]
MSSSSSSSTGYENMIQTLSGSYRWPEVHEKTLLEPFTYVTTNGGKQIRSKLMEAFNEWLHVPPERLAIIANIVSMLHNASLLIDDVEDNSQLRRGTPVAHKIYGVPQTINSANYVYFLAYKELFKLRDLMKAEGTEEQGAARANELEQIVTEELLNLHRGQGLELFWRDSLTCPTEDEYVQMVNGKTGGLLRIGIKLMMSSSSSTVDYVPLTNLIGVWFQIRDDYMNLDSTEYYGTKGYAEDLTEGKFSFPIVHSVRADTSNRQVLNVLQKRPTTPTTKRYIIGYMRDSTGSFEYTRSVLRTLEAQALEEISKLGGNERLEKIVKMFSVEGSNQAEPSGK